MLAQLAIHFDGSFLAAVTGSLLRLTNSLPAGLRLYRKIDQRWKKNAEGTNYVKQHMRMIEAADAIIGEPTIDLVLLHLPFPHVPAFFDRKTDQFGSSSGYFDNIALCDKVPGESKLAMVQPGLRDKSTIIISADHPWRIKSLVGSISFTDEDREISQGIEPMSRLF